MTFEDTVKSETAAVKKATRAMKDYTAIHSAGLTAEHTSERIILNALGGAGT